MKIENWKIISLNNDENYQVVGQVYGKKGVTDGEWIRTSNIVLINFEVHYVHTINSVYNLGKHAEGTVRMGEER